MGNFLGDFLSNTWESFQGLPHIQSASQLSPEQQGLLSQLAAFASNNLKAPNQGEMDLTSLMSGNSPLLGQLSNNLFSALMGQSMNQFDKVIKPQIDSSFASIGGTLSSRRNNVYGQTLSDMLTNAQTQVAQMQPNLLGFIGNTISQRSQLQYLPFQQALSFALQPTMYNTMDNRVGSLWQGGDAYMQALGKFGGMATAL